MSRDMVRLLRRGILHGRRNVAVGQRAVEEVATLLHATEEQVSHVANTATRGDGVDYFRQGLDPQGNWTGSAAHSRADDF